MPFNIKNFLLSRKIHITLICLFVIGFLMSLVGIPGSLDAQLIYSESFAKQFFESLTPQEIKRYHNNELLDLLFILTYTALFYQLLAKVKPGKAAIRAFVP